MGGSVIRLFRQRPPGDCRLRCRWVTAGGGSVKIVDTLRGAIRRSEGSCLGVGSVILGRTGEGTRKRKVALLK